MRGQKRPPPLDPKTLPEEKRTKNNPESDAANEAVKSTKAKPASSSAKPSEKIKKKDIQWVLPKNCSVETKKTFAPLLFGQPWEELKNITRTPLDLPHLPSPVHNETSADVYEAERDDRIKKFRISQELQDFHNAIWQENENYFGDAAGERDGLIGFPEKDPVSLGENQTGTLKVTPDSPKTKTTDSVSIEIIQRAAPGETPELFIELSRGLKIWVNNREIENKAKKDDGSKMYIGPIGEFAILELLQVPIFLWRNRIDAGSGIAADIPRTASRSRIAEAQGAKTSVTFTTHDGKGIITSGGDKGTPNGDASGPNNDSTQQTDTRLSVETERDLKDAELLIYRVLVAISDLQKEHNGGFTIANKHFLVRPGLTWLLPLHAGTKTVLAVLQYVSTFQGGEITIHVLDPMQWCTAKGLRNGIYKMVTGHDVLQRWISGIGLDLEDLVKVLSKIDLEWVDSPVAADNEEAFVITVLNAWILAMGLDLNPNWMLHKEPGEDGQSPVDRPIYMVNFLERARELFTLALSDELDWEVVYSFARDQKYILNEEPPREDRQFRLQNKSYSDSLNSQDKAQRRYTHTLNSRIFAESQKGRRARREAFNRRSEAVRINITGKKTRNTTRFPAEDWADYKAKHFEVENIIKKGRWRRDLTPGQISRIHDELTTLAASGAPPQNSTKPSKPFDPCDFVRTKLEEMEKAHEVGKKVKRSNVNNVLQIDKIIRAVSQAIIRTSSQESSLECVGYDITRGMTRYQGTGLTVFPIWLKNTIKTNRDNGGTFRHALAVVQPSSAKQSGEHNDQTRRFSLHVFDHAPWLSSPDLRGVTYTRLRHMILSMTGLEDIKIEGDDISWIVNPPPNYADSWQLSYYAILNAWTICMGLHVNQQFRAGEDFFTQADRIIRFVLSGHADWKLIWSFLRCKEYVLAEEVPENRQFSSTVAETQLRADLGELSSEALSRPKKRFVPYDMPTSATQFPTDTWKFGDYPILSKIINPGLRAGVSVAELDATTLVKRKIDPGDAEDMQTDDVARSVASVTLAVTKNQNSCSGLNWAGTVLVDSITQWMVGPKMNPIEGWLEDALDPDDPTKNRPIRFSRPIILAANFEHHLSLMVIQYDDEQNITATITDSFPWGRTDDNPDRKWLRETAYEVINWWKWDGETSRKVPLVVSDVKCAPCAYQTTNFTCGYHTIFNGWAAVLGLRLNPRFYAEWSSDFISQALDIITLVLLGEASSDMIHAFLAAIEFVEPSQVIEESRRFERTAVGVELDNLYAEMKSLVGTKGGKERVCDYQKIRHTDKVQFLDNQYSSEWPFDSWNASYAPFISQLVRKVQKTLDIGELDDNQLFYQLRLHCKKSFKEGAQAYDKLRSGFNQQFREYKKQIKEDKSLTIQKFHHLIRLDKMEPDYIEKDAAWVYALHRAYLLPLLGVPSKLLDVKPLLWGEVIKAVAAVLQAIDRKHSQQAEESKVVYAGGFALTTETPITTGQGALARPRRCWLLPWQFQEVGAERIRAHNFLAVVQEEEKADGKGSQFCVYFLDSAPDIWEERKGKRFDLFKLIKEKARGLSWTTHRNPNGQVKFCSKPRYVNVAKQVGSTACGYHTVVNAWILALGMTPKVDPKKKLDIGEVSRVIKFAIRGVLDWKTLVAWLFACDLTVETKIEQVTLSRAFDVTEEQGEEEWELEESIRTQFEEHDELLSNISEDEVPYVRNNVDFSGENWTFEPEETLEEEEDDSQQDNESPGGLARSTEDIDMLYYEYDDDDEEWSSFFEDLARIAYRDKRNARRRDRNRASMGFASSGGIKSKRYTSSSSGRVSHMYR